MIISFTELHELVDRGIITNVDDKLINGSSIDITIGPNILIEVPPVGYGLGIQRCINLGSKESLPMHKFQMTDKVGYTIQPGEFILAHSEQQFNLPLDISAEYKLKSSMARIGLEHLNAGWCDPGWNNSVLTLELVNCSRYTAITIRPGDKIGQVVFFRHTPVPKDYSYYIRGRYNGDTEVSGRKPEKI